MKNRLPRKLKKWLKKTGGWEYYIRVPRKIKGCVTEDDFKDIMDSLCKDYDRPVYEKFVGVTFRSKPIDGLYWTLITSAEKLF